MTQQIVRSLVVCAAIVGTAACGAEPAPPPAASPAETSATATGPVSSPTSLDATVITITIAGGTVRPTNAQAEATVGQPIVLEVSSDAVDSIHVHSIPEQTFDVQARPDQRFEFTVKVPGQVDVELHELHRTIVTIQVRP